MKKVLVVNGPSYFEVNKKFGEYTGDLKIIMRNPEEVSLVVFTGGADVSPSIYGHKMNPKTCRSHKRDLDDECVFEHAQRWSIPCVGICRGGQYLTAKAGGYLYQHVNGHTMSNHGIMTYQGQFFKAPGDHHQMFGMPLLNGAELLAWSAVNKSDVYETGEGVVGAPEKEPEAVYYPNIFSLAFQYHPEWSSPSEDCWKFYVKMVEKYLL